MSDAEGTIDRADFRSGMRLLDARMMRYKSDEEIDAMFDKLDIDGDGVLELHQSPVRALRERLYLAREVLSLMFK